MISKELLLFIETDFSLMVKGSKISEPSSVNAKVVSIKSRSSLLIISEEVMGGKNN